MKGAKNMFNRKIQILLATAMVCVLLFAGCEAKKPSDGTSASDTSQSNVSAETVGATENKISTTALAQTDSIELKALREKIKGANKSVGVAFVDYVGGSLSDEDVATYFEHTEILKEYPFLKDAQMKVLDGEQLFVFVPADEKGVITLYATELNDEGEVEVKKDKPICVGKAGMPLAVRCNVSEVYSNILVSVTDGDKTCEFHPMVSLADGVTLDLKEGCYDFSIDNIRKHQDEAYYILSNNITEVKEALDNGYDIVDDGNFYFCNQMMIRYKLGKYNENGDGFVCKKQYAVSFDAIYAQDPETHQWYVIGAGLKND